MLTTKRYIISILLIFAFFLDTSATPNTFLFRHYKVEDGLSSNTIQSIFQDSRNFIWIGTTDGLNRFDSHRFKTYRHIIGDSCSIGNNNIQAICEDRENRLWIGTDAGIYIYSKEFDNFESVNNYIGGSKVEKIHTACYSIVNDSINNEVWIATIGQGLFRYNVTEKKLYQYRHDKQNNRSISSDFILKLMLDSKGQLWIASYNAGLNIYNHNNDNFTAIKPDDNQKGGLTEPNSFALFEDSFSNIWIGGWSKGLIKYDQSKKQFNSYLHEGAESILRIHSITEYVPGELLIGSDNGLTFFSIQTGKSNTIKSNPSDTRGLSNNFVYSIFKDKEGGIWIGTYFGGINYLVPNNAFKWYVPSVSNGNETIIHGKVISCFCEDDSGNVWIGTGDGGLNKFDPVKELFERIYLDDKNMMPLNIHTLCIDGDHLWIGTFNDGLYKFNFKNGTHKHYRKDKGLDDNRIYSVYKDKAGNLWVGAKRGIYNYNSDNDQFVQIDKIDWGGDVVDIIEDDKGVVWFASQRRGVYSYNLKTKAFLNYTNTNSNQYFVPDNSTNCLCYDNKNRLWLGTAQAGLCLFDEITNSFIRIEQDNAIFNSAIYSIVAERDNLWITTNQGLICYNADSRKATTYATSDGLQNNQFNLKAGIKTASGDIYVGGVDGFNVFNPLAISKNPHIPPVVFTQFQLFNKNVPIGNNSALKKSIDCSDVIVLSHKQSAFSIDFVALSYCAPQKNQYAFMLEGFDSDWTSPESNEYQATYTSLPSGKYIFKVKASNNDGVWNENGAQIEFIIRPPWWKSTVMVIIYIVLFISVIIAADMLMLKQATKKHEAQLKVVKNEKERELLDVKLQLFTNITHEVRTPVALITAPIERILKSETFLPRQVKEDLAVVQKNSTRLLNLVNQLLDLQKTERGIDVLNYKACNINTLLNNIIEQFKIITEYNNINLYTNYNVDNIIAYTDPEAINKIVSNLLSNAIKFTKDTIVITMDKNDNAQEFAVSVKDNGIGMSNVIKEQIFSPFFQAQVESKTSQKGFGIGLALVNSLIEKLNGSIHVDSKEGEYSVFTINIPMGTVPHVIENDAHNNEIVENNFIMEAATVSTDEESSEELKMKEIKKGHVLVVEDNDDFRNFLRRNLDTEYNVMIANSGNEAINVLKSQNIDIIVSDIVMPWMSGIDLCRMVKSNLQTCHIPIILLTAKTDTQSKIEGLKSGAEVYLEKPFSMEYLKAQINSLFENRVKLREIFSNTPFAPLNSIINTKADEELLKKINTVIEKNLSNSDFSVDDIANALNMSRSSLYTKIKAISGLTPNDFVRLLRLRKAAEYLSKSEYRISEICYLVGFSNPSYFAKCFQKQFGVLPKEFVPRKE